MPDTAIIKIKCAGCASIIDFNTADIGEQLCCAQCSIPIDVRAYPPLFEAWEAFQADAREERSRAIEKQRAEADRARAERDKAKRCERERAERQRQEKKERRASERAAEEEARRREIARQQLLRAVVRAATEDVSDSWVAVKTVHDKGWAAALIILALISFAVGAFVTFVLAKSVVHEIFGALLWVIGAIFFCGCSNCGQNHGGRACYRRPTRSRFDRDVKETSELETGSCGSGVRRMPHVFVMRQKPGQIDMMEEALRSQELICGWGEAACRLIDVKEAPEFTSTILEIYGPTWPDAKEPDNEKQQRDRARAKAGSLFAFLRKMKVGDIVIAPHRDEFYIGRILGTAKPDGAVVRRSVLWLNDRKPLQARHVGYALQKRLSLQPTCFSLRNASALADVWEVVCQYDLPIDCPTRN